MSKTIPISAADGVVWPAIPVKREASILALCLQLEHSQWWSPEELQQRQLQQLAQLLKHACKTVPWYSQENGYRAAIRTREMTEADFRQIPITKRADIQTAGRAMHSRKIPRSHLPTSIIRTSGSTGRPISCHKTMINVLFYQALELRGHFWQQHDFAAKVAMIKVAKNKEFPPKKQKNWVNGFVTGPAYQLDAGLPLSTQLEWLLEEKPEHLVLYPSNLAALCKLTRERGITVPALKRINTMGEVLTPETRELCRDTWGLSITDNYSCQEIGVLALQCPQHEHYHVQSESVILEVLDEHDEPCLPGQVGRVVVTDLHNFAMPLIRYEIGDYAEVGEPCSCGRGLPVLRRVLGRTRNMLVRPSGELYWPSFVISDWARLGPIQQLQLVQKTAASIQVNLVVSRPMSQEDENIICTAMSRDMGEEYSFQFVYVDEIPRSANGKFEDFKSEVAAS